MSVHDILRELHNLRARLEPRDGQLKLRAGKRSVPEPLVEQIRAAKLELLAFLENSPTSPSGVGHLRVKTPIKAAETLASSEDGQMATFVATFAAQKTPKSPSPSPQTPLKPAEILASTTATSVSAEGGQGGHPLGHLREPPYFAPSSADTAPAKSAGNLAFPEDDQVMRPLDEPLYSDQPAAEGGHEGGQMDTFDEPQHFCVFETPKTPKVANSPGSIGSESSFTPQPKVMRLGTSSAVGIAADELPFDEPCPERRGLTERRGALFLHFCVECGRWGAYGYDLARNRPGRWYCRQHRPDEVTR